MLRQLIIRREKVSYLSAKHVASQYASSIASGLGYLSSKFHFICVWLYSLLWLNNRNTRPYPQKDLSSHFLQQWLGDPWLSFPMKQLHNKQSKWSEFATCKFCVYLQSLKYTGLKWELFLFLHTMFSQCTELHLTASHTHSFSRTSELLFGISPSPGPKNTAWISEGHFRVSNWTAPVLPCNGDLKFVI